MTKQQVLSDLKKHLHTAIALEHSTLPPYLTAYWSIHGNSENALHVKDYFLSVIREEMLHMAMACNILNAIGGTPFINDPSILPSFPSALPGHSKTNNAFIVHLDKCCPQAVANFAQIEMPEELAGKKHYDDGWSTIGEFYDEIAALIRHDSLSDLDFAGGRQVDNSFNPGKGTLYTVHSRQDALNALDEIIDQGEGHSGKLYNKDHELTHYWKFITIRDLMAKNLWHYEAEVMNMGRDPDEKYFSEDARQINYRFNILYSELLDAMQVAFSSEVPLLAEPIRIMYMLKKPAITLMQLPLIGKAGNAGPTFRYLSPEERIALLHP